MSMMPTPGLITRVSAVALALALALHPCDGLRALVIGGAGRVGGSAVTWLLRLAHEEGREMDVVVGGRSRSTFDRARGRLESRLPPELASRISYTQMDLTDDASIRRALEGVDVCVHTAGPFQSVTDPAAVRACVEAGVPYMDVCDNTELAERAREDYAAKARDTGVAAVVAGGIWPGVSALMAAKAVGKLPGNAADDVELSFFTAGTGNAGPAIVAATFHLLCEPVFCLRDGKPVRLRPWTEPRRVEFAGGAGERSVYLLDNPDVATLACTALEGRVRSLSSRFGTAPQVWNELFRPISWLPERVLQDRPLMAAATAFSSPIIRAVDYLVGSTNAMRVDARSLPGPDGAREAVTLQLVHPDLEDCVGLATAAFTRELLRGTVPAGVQFAAELAGTDAGDAILECAKRGGVWEETETKVAA